MIQCWIAKKLCAGITHIVYKQSFVHLNTGLTFSLQTSNASL